MSHYVAIYTRAHEGDEVGQTRQLDACLARVEAETGLRPRIISAREEAELAMESCAPLLEQQDRRALLFDIGGGSTEIAWIRVPAAGLSCGQAPAELIGYVSMPLGVVTLAERAGASCFTEEGFGAVVEEVAEHERVWQAVLTLPRRQRAVIVLKYFEDLSEAEIAETLHMARGTVKSHGHAAARRLAVLLAEPADGSSSPVARAAT